MDACIKQSQAEEHAKFVEERIYRRLRLYNLIERAEKMTHPFMNIKEKAYAMTNIPAQRHRLSKELTEDLLAEKGEDGAYMHCLERLANNTQNPALWRDVLTFLDEMKGNKNET